MSSNHPTVREVSANYGVCARCGAAAGEVCRTPSGKVAGTIHKDRPRNLTEREQFRANQKIGPVGTFYPSGGRPRSSAKGKARTERKRALHRRRGFGA